MRRLVPSLLLLQVIAVVAFGSAPEQHTSPTSDASRVQDLVRGEWPESDVCLHDVNDDGVEDFLLVLRSVRSVQDPTDWQESVALNGFAVVGLDAVLEVKKNSQDWQAELVYLRVFDRLFEVPLSTVADCTGSIEDKDYRACLMRAYLLPEPDRPDLTRERTGAYPTLPSCPATEG